MGWFILCLYTDRLKGKCTGSFRKLIRNSIPWFPYDTCRSDRTVDPCRCIRLRLLDCLICNRCHQINWRLVSLYLGSSWKVYNRKLIQKRSYSHFVVCNQLRDRRISLHVALTLRLPTVECLISTTYLESIGMRRLTNADFLLCWQGLKIRFTICSQIHKILSISSSRPNFDSLTHLPTVHGPSKTISAATCVYLDHPASKFKLF